MRMTTLPAIVAVLSIASQTSFAQSTCHTADRRSDHFIETVKQLMGADGAAARAHLSLPIVDSSQITLVIDPVVCARAGQALDSLNHAMQPDATIPPPDTLPLYVIQVGTSFAVADLNSQSTGDFDYLLFFGPLWQFLNLGLA
jgi:hypothetical protein